MQLFRLPHLVVMIWTIEIHNDDVIMTVDIVMVIEEIKEVVRQRQRNALSSLT